MSYSEEGLYQLLTRFVEQLEAHNQKLGQLLERNQQLIEMMLEGEDPEPDSEPMQYLSGKPIQ